MQTAQVQLEPAPACAAEQQLGLFGHDAPAVDLGFERVRRLQLARGAWIDHAPGWLAGHATLFDALAQQTRWRTVQEVIYDKLMTAPRLVAVLPADGPGHPELERMAAALARRYATSFMRLGLGLYRHGRDSVAWHGDRVARQMNQALVATISLGAPRRFLVRPHGGGASIGFNLGWGDLLVMGGSCQRTYQHCVPKVAHAQPRIAVMFRNFGLE